ncbi:MAG: hypothetical protein WCG02_04235 [Candidatus Taylorbacteria bacterium]
MAINGGTFAGTEDKDPTEPKSDTSKHWKWIIILAVIVIFLIIAAVPFIMYIVSEAKSLGGAGPTAPQPQQAAQVVHQPYRVGWITVAKSYGEVIRIDSDAGENIQIEPADQPVKYYKQVNGRKEFSVDLDFGNNAVDYISEEQVHSLAFRANGDDQVGRKIVYILYKWGVQPPSDWRLQAVRAMQGIK